jgi:hypothetical protein
VRSPVVQLTVPTPFCTTDFSSIAAELIGAHAIHHCVELSSKVVDLARRLAGERGLDAIEFHCANVHSVDVGASMKFDRIYVGAGVLAVAMRTKILSLLKPGGVAVGPFATDNSELGLLRATRLPDGAVGEDLMSSSADEEESFCTATGCMLKRLAPASFASLQGPDDDDKRIVLLAPRWGSTRPSNFPPMYLHVVATLYLGTTHDPVSMCSKLPWDIWNAHVFPNLDRNAFGEL